MRKKRKKSIVETIRVIAPLQIQRLMARACTDPLTNSSQSLIIIYHNTSITHARTQTHQCVVTLLSTLQLATAISYHNSRNTAQDEQC